MEDSPLGLDKWMCAIWMLANCKNGISSYELGKTLGIRQQSAWFMLHRIREAMKQEPKGKFGFRFNNRATKDNKLTDADRFALVMMRVAGKRLTYAQLTGKGTDTVCHPEAGTGQEEQPF